ncbi:MAG: hypothetical protein COA97_05145 [Flavobacteriales bacterium]|nr:MAG: hypothetical protein COA97_05145 [Flavobacteriales bacterium]
MKRKNVYLSKTDYYHHPIPNCVGKEIEERRLIMETKVSNFKKKPSLIELFSNKILTKKNWPIKMDALSKI